MSPMFKNHHFKSENEFRIVIANSLGNKKPHESYPIDKKSIFEINFAPNFNKFKDKKLDVIKKLKAAGLFNSLIQINKSTIPYV